MKIFNQAPIRLTEFIFNKEHLPKVYTDSSYQSGFRIRGEVLEGLKTLTATFRILCTVDDESTELITPSSDPNQFNIHAGGIMFTGATFLSYKSSCQFNFEGENYDEDVRSITEFLEEFCIHTKKILEQHGLEYIIKREEEIRTIHNIDSDARIGIENLRSNNAYQF